VSSPAGSGWRRGIAIHRVRDGKIVEFWVVTDVARVLQQVGALAGPPG
jgi:predicted SnoaL-like aldol condensation-catalyzing enzyme